MAQPVVDRPVMWGVPRWGLFRVVLVILAVLCFAAFALYGFGVWHGGRPSGWLGLGLALFAASFL